MRKPELQPDWPESWKESWPYDAEEVFGPISCRGYAYAYANRRKQALDLIQQVASPGARVLDVAAAQGNFSLALAEMGFHVTWNDLRTELADYVRAKWEHGRIEFAAGNVFEMEFPAPFDLVLITEIIEHVAHPDQFLRQISRLIKPGGHVVMTTPNGAYFLNRLPKFSECLDPSQFEAVQFKPNSDGHIFLLHEAEVRSLATAAGFETVDLRLLTNPLTNGHLKMEYLLKILPHEFVNRVERLTLSLPTPLQRRLHTTIAVLFRRIV